MSRMMPKGRRQLLLPASPVFIWISIFIALILNILENFMIGGWVAWVPDFLAVTLVFWSLHQPRRVGMGIAFALGLATDVHQTTLLGQHALCYTLLSFIVGALQRRVMWFKLGTQAMQLFPLFAAMHFLEFSLRMMFGHAWPSWHMLLAPFIESLLWPIASTLLLLPQRRSPDPDANRPL